MKKRFLTFILAVCMMIPGVCVMTACNDGGDPPSKTVNGIEVTHPDAEGVYMYVPYRTSFDGYFTQSDFSVYATYTDGTQSDTPITEGVTMTQSGVFDVSTNTGQLIFTYGEYSTTIYVSVGAIDISTAEFVLSGVEDSYTLSEGVDCIMPTPTLMWGSVTLEKDVDYSVEYGGNGVYDIGEDKGTVTVRGTGNFTGSKTTTFDILPIPCEVNIAFENQTYTYGDDIDIVIPYEDYANIPSIFSIDYEYSDDNGATWSTDIYNIEDVGTYKVKAIFNMTLGYAQVDDMIKTITIEPKSISDYYSEIAQYNTTTYTGSNVLITSLNEDRLIREDEASYSNYLVYGTDYEVDATYNEDGFTNGYKNNLNAGVAQVRVKGIGNFTGAKTVGYTIDPKNLNGENIIISGVNSRYTFTGSDIEPEVTSVVYDTTTLVEGQDYSVEYADTNKYYMGVDIDAGQVMIVFKNNYAGYAYKTFVIDQWVLDITNLDFGVDTLDNALTYNFDNQVVTYSTASLSGWLEDLAESDMVNGTDYASLIYTPQNTDGILKINYSYTYSTEYSTNSVAVPNIVGDYTVTAEFVCEGDEDDYDFRNSIKIVRDSEEIDYYTETRDFRINVRNINAEDVALTYQEDYGVDVPHFTYGCTEDGIIEPPVNAITKVNGKVVDIAVGYDRGEGNSYRIYTVEENPYTVYLRSTDNYTIVGEKYLEYYVDSVVITQDNLTEYFEVPTVTRMIGNYSYEGMFVSTAVPTDKVLPCDDEEKYKFIIQSIGYDSEGNEIANLKLNMKNSYGNNNNYVSESLVVPVIAENPVTLGFYSEIKVNYAYDDYDGAQDYTGSFFLLDELPKGAYIYLTLDEGVEFTIDTATQNTLTKGDYTVYELLGAMTAVEVPEGASYRAYKLYDDELSANMMFNITYNPKDIRSLYRIDARETYTAMTTEHILDMDVLVSSTALDGLNPQSIKGTAEKVADGHYKTRVLYYSGKPTEAYVSVTIPESGVTSLQYSYVANSNSAGTSLQDVNIVEGSTTYRIEVDYMYGYAFYIYVNGDREMIVEIEPDYAINDIYVLSRHYDSYDGYDSDEFYRVTLDLASMSDYEQGIEYSVYFDSSNCGTIKQLYMKSMINKGYVMLDSEGNEPTTFEEGQVYTLKIFNTDAPETILAEYQLHII